MLSSGKTLAISENHFHDRKPVTLWCVEVAQTGWHTSLQQTTISWSQVPGPSLLPELAKGERAPSSPAETQQSLAGWGRDSCSSHSLRWGWERGKLTSPADCKKRPAECRDLRWHLARTMGLASQVLAKTGPGVFIFIRFPLQRHSNANKAPNKVSRHGVVFLRGVASQCHISH